MTTIIINGHIDAIGDIDYAEGGTVRGVLIKMHADDVRQIAAGRLLFTDVRVTFERREPGDEPPARASIENGGAS